MRAHRGVARILAALFTSVVVFGVCLSGDHEPAFNVARAALERGDYRDAENLANDLLSRLDAAEGADPLAVADALELLVDARLSQRWWPTQRLLDQAERALDIKREHLGESHVGLAGSLYLVGSIKRRLEGHEAAIPLLERALALARSGLGPGHPLEGRILSSLALSERDEGHVDAAIEDLRRAVDIVRNALGAENPRTAAMLCGLTYMLAYHKGDRARAMELLEEELRVIERAHGPSHPWVAGVLVNLGNFQLNDSRLEDARRSYERALDIALTLYGPDHSDVMNSWFGLACVARSRGEYDRALLLFEKAIGHIERIRGPHAVKLASVMYSVGRLYRLTGDYVAARRAYERSLTINEMLYGPDHPYVSMLLTRYAILLSNLGDQKEARAACERALTTFENASPRNPGRIANTLAVLSLIQFHQGEHDASLETAHEVLRLFEEAGVGPDSPPVIETRAHIARILAKRGKLAEAQRRLEQNLRDRERVFGTEHPYTANTLQRLAELVAARGDDQRAIALTRRALMLREKSLGAAHPKVGWSRAGLCCMLARAGHTEQALEEALAAESIGREHLRLTAQALPERQALGYAGIRTRGLDVALSIVAERPADGRAVVRVWTAMARSRALVLDELASRHRAVGDVSDPEIATLAESLASARASLANIMVRGAGSQSPEAYQSLLGFARKRKERAEWALADKSRAFRHGLAERRLALADVKEHLPGAGALVSYVKYLHYPVGRAHIDRVGKGDRAEVEPTWRYAALVVRADRDQPAVVPLGPSTDLDSLIAAWKKSVSTMPSALAGPARAAESRYRGVASSLRRALWDPLASHLDGARTVFIVPDGAIHFVNVAALPSDGDGYLVETGPVLHHVSSERDIARTDHGPLNDGLLALGGADFDADPSATVLPAGTRVTTGDHAPAQRASARPIFRGSLSDCAALRDLRFVALPGTEQEIQEISALWTDAAANAADEGSPVLGLSGRRANESALKVHAADYRVLHLATHGFVLNAACAPSAPGEAPGFGELVRSDGTPPAGPAENPLRLSGIVLAGANRRDVATEGTDDGILTAEEIASLDLSGVEWAVLSSCESAIGPVMNGEGVLGLRRAFRIAGARTLIMSLWPVQDEMTRQWMHALYAARREGASTADAVREASLHVLTQRREAGQPTHPFYWGAFVAAGDWH